MRTLCILLFSSLMFTACGEGSSDGKPTASSLSDVEEDEGSSSPTPPPSPDARDREDASTATDTGIEEGRFGDHYTLVRQPKVEDGVLVFLVQYGGGCAEHSFDVFPYPHSDEHPDVLRLDLVHDDGGDRCLALPISMQMVDLADLLSEACTTQLALDTPDGTFIVDLPVDPACEG